MVVDGSEGVVLCVLLEVLAGKIQMKYPIIRSSRSNSRHQPLETVPLSTSTSTDVSTVIIRFWLSVSSVNSSQSPCVLGGAEIFVE